MASVERFRALNSQEATIATLKTLNSKSERTLITRVTVKVLIKLPVIST